MVAEPGAKGRRWKLEVSGKSTMGRWNGDRGFARLLNLVEPCDAVTVAGYATNSCESRTFFPVVQVPVFTSFNTDPSIWRFHSNLAWHRQYA